MRPIFEEMKAHALEWLACFSSKSSLAPAMSYFLKNWNEFVLFTDPGPLDVPIDNNVRQVLSGA